MGRWLADNALALYGAIVGTTALVLTVVRFNYDRLKDSVQLRVSSRPVERFAENVQKLANASAGDRTQPTFLPAYSVVVTNDGLVPAHLADAGVVDSTGNRSSALVSDPSLPSDMLWSIGEAGIKALSPKSSRTFTVYMYSDEPTPSPVSCFVEDKTGKAWAGRHNDS